MVCIDYFLNCGGLSLLRSDQDVYLQQGQAKFYILAVQENTAWHFAGFIRTFCGALLLQQDSQLSFPVLCLVLGASPLSNQHAFQYKITILALEYTEPPGESESFVWPGDVEGLLFERLNPSDLTTLGKMMHITLWHSVNSEHCPVAARLRFFAIFK